MASSETPVHHVRSAICAWAAGPSDDIAALEEAWCTAGMSTPLYTAACTSIFPTLDALIDYFSCARHHADRMLPNLPASSSSSSELDGTFPPVQVFRPVVPAHSESRTMVTINSDKRGLPVRSLAIVEESKVSKPPSVVASSTSSALLSSSHLVPQRRSARTSAKASKKIPSGHTESSTATVSRSSGGEMVLEERGNRRRALPARRSSPPMQTHVSPLLPIQQISASGEFQSFPCVPSEEEKSIAKTRQLAKAKEHAASTYVTRVAKLHALLIAEGVPSEYTRAHCIHALFRAASLFDVDEDMVRKSVFLPPVPDESVFRIRTASEHDLSAVCLAGHAVATLNALSPFLLQLPRPVSSALRENKMLCELGFALSPDKSVRRRNHQHSEFPEPVLDLWAPDIGSIPAVTIHEGFEAVHQNMDGRLYHNMQRAYDSVLRMHRLHRGDLGRPQELDPESVLHTVAGLHSASIRNFATLFLRLLISSVLIPPCNASDEVQPEGVPWSLDVRNRDDCIAQSQGVSARAGSPYPQLSDKNKRGVKQSSLRVLLDSIPTKVRKLFATNRSEAFFLEFLVLADSHRLMSGLTLELCLHLSSALSAAAQARNNADFTEAVVEARLVAKFLSVRLHFSNWSKFGLPRSGEATGMNIMEEDDKSVDEELTHNVCNDVHAPLAMYTAAQLRAVIDLGKLLRDARATGNSLAALATAAVVHVMLTLAHVDPFARSTTWFNDAIAAVQEAACSSDALLSVLCEGLLKSIGAPLQGALFTQESLVQAWHTWGAREQGLAIGDLRFMTECTPGLVDLRDAVLSSVQSLPAHCIKPQSTAVERAEASATGKLDRKSGNEIIYPQMLSLAVSDFNIRVKTIVRLTISAGHNNPEEASSAFRAAAKSLAPNEHEDVLSFAAEWVAIQVKKKTKESKQSTKKAGKRLALDRARSSQLEAALDALYGKLSPDDTAAVLGRHRIKMEKQGKEMSQQSGLSR